jgi:hypothetical protein
LINIEPPTSFTPKPVRELRNFGVLHLPNERTTTRPPTGKPQQNASQQPPLKAAKKLRDTIPDFEGAIHTLKVIL